MPTAKSKASSKTTKTIKAKAKKPVSKAVVAEQQHKRNKFVAAMVVLAAALIAISAGMYSHDRYTSSKQASAITGPGSMYLLPTSNEPVRAGTTLKVTLYENSGNDPVNAVQSDVKYPTDKLEFVSVKSSDEFPQEAATDTATPGLVRVARSVKTQEPAVTGSKPVVTMEFRVLQNADSPLVFSIDKTGSFLVRSTDNQNILQHVPKTTYRLEN